jgi:methyl-accepting chemotaxis protein
MMSVLRTIRAKLMFSMVLLAAVAVVVGVIGLYELGNLNSRLEFIVKVANQRVVVVSNIEKQLLSLYRMQKNHILEPEGKGMREREAEVAALDAGIKKSAEEWRAIASEQGKKKLAEFEAAYQQFMAVNARVVQMSTEQKKREAFNLSQEDGRDTFRACSKTLEEGVEFAQEFMASEVKATDEAYSRTRLAMILVCVLGVSASVAFAMIVVRGTVKGMLAVTERIKDVAEGEGDLTKRIPVTSKDELAELSTWFNTFMDKLHDIISQVAVGTEHIASATEEISSSATQVAQGADVQRDQTSQVATAMQEMASTVTQVSDSSHKAAENAMKASETARKGGKIVEDTVSTIRSLADSSQDTAQKVQELGKSSDQIGRIIGVIDDIADQTNLLALNAAIEAARAGDQGRGFAVVADEVRKLAERTTGATKEIAQMIQTIQKETANAVQAMESATKQVERSVTTTLEAGDSLQEIIRSADQVGEMITQIATAATQQSSATEQINGSVDKISKLVNESAVGAQQSAKACTDLSNLALDLQALVGKFKLGNSEQRAQKSRTARGLARAHVQHAPMNRGNGHSLLEQYESEVSTLVQ